MTESICNPTSQDSQNLIRETLRMSTAVRQSALIPRRPTLLEPDTPGKKARLRQESRVVGVHCDPKPKVGKLKVERMQAVTFQGQGNNTSSSSSLSLGEKSETPREVVV